MNVLYPLKQAAERSFIRLCLVYLTLYIKWRWIAEQYSDISYKFHGFGLQE